MSKCKAVLDGEKITEIRVKTKAQETSQKDEPKSKDSEKSGEDFRATQQSE
jgi:hypothetical protein